MSLEINTEESHPSGRVAATERLYRTEDGRLVPEGHPDARWLFCVPGQMVAAADLAGQEPADAGAEITPEEPQPEPEQAAEGDGVEKQGVEVPLGEEGVVSVPEPVVEEAEPAPKAARKRSKPKPKG